MDSLEWSKKYDVICISRLVLRDVGFPTEQITSLTDADMQAIADALSEELRYVVSGFSESVRFIASLYLAEQTANPTGGSDGTEPMRQDRET